MKAFVTAVDETTKHVCVDQLKRFGFDVELLDEVELWANKYRRFLERADGPCLRVDADIIVNSNIRNIEWSFCNKKYLLTQYQVYDLYQNAIHSGIPVFYTLEAIKIIRKNIHLMDERRPETWASRLPEINARFGTIAEVVGMHGFFQNQVAIDRAIKNKTDRGQMDKYDFELVNKLMNL